MKVFGKVLISLLIILAMISCSFAPARGSMSQSVEAQVISNQAAPGQDYLAPSQNPPGGLTVKQTPMFVTIGFDDNPYVDGMEWAIGAFGARKNPAGTGQAGTFDGAPALASFYGNSTYLTTGQIKQVWRKAFDAGHELGNHTHSHHHGKAFSVPDWEREIRLNNEWLMKPYAATSDSSKGIGLTFNQIGGFRTPFLEYNTNTFTAVQNIGLPYDCSIEEGFQWEQDGRNFLFPYTMDNGSPGHQVKTKWKPPYNAAPIGKYPGLWQMPTHVVIVPPELRETMNKRTDYFSMADGKITGLDYNLFYEYKVNKAEFVAILKHTLDLRLEGNRAPMTFGGHSNYYSSTSGVIPASPADPNSGSTHIERQQAVEEFLDYALSKEVVRVTTIENIRQWMRNPVALPPTNTKYLVTPTSGPNGTITPSVPTEVPAYDDITIEFAPAPGYMIDTVTRNGKAVAKKDINDLKYTFRVMEATTINATFKKMAPAQKYRMTYFWTYDPVDEPIPADQLTGNIVPLLTLDGDEIAQVDEAYARRYGLEGSGFLDLPNGERVLINLANDAGYPDARFMIVAPERARWGLDSQGNSLDPWKTLAVDPNFIPLGGDVYIQEFAGVSIPYYDHVTKTTVYKVHNGWFKAMDTSHSFTGMHLDVFAARYPYYVEVYNEILKKKDFCNIQGDVNIVATHTVTPSIVGNVGGEISPYEAVEVADGGSVYFNMKPAAEYSIEYVKIDGGATDVTNQLVFANGVYTYTFENVTAPNDIAVKFRTVGITHTITPSVVGNEGGTISPATAVEVADKGSYDFTMTPAAKYSIEYVKTNGGTVDVTSQLVETNGVYKYTFTNVTAANDIQVKFKKDDVPPGGLTATYSKTGDWGSGFGANVVVKNTGTEAVSTWTVTWTFSGDQTVTSLWNGSFTQTGQKVTVTPTGWNGSIQPGGTVSFGFNGGPYTGTNPVPSDIKAF